LLTDIQTIEKLLDNNPKDSDYIKCGDSIKQLHEAFLEAVNDKLIDCLEQNIIFKYNIKELLDLNQTNHNQVYKFNAR
jgi:hypothetical protein